ELRLGDRHRVTLNRGTEAVISASRESDIDADPVWRVDLRRGELFAEVESPARFSVTTPNALSEITGTAFNVRTDGRETELTLLEGSIRFSAPGSAGSKPVKVTAGFASRVVGSAAPTTPRRVDAVAATAW